MHFSELPCTELVGFAATADDMVDLLDEVTGHSQKSFRHFDRAIDGPRSCRLLFHEAVAQYTYTKPLPRPYDNAMTAREFFHPVFMAEVRCDPPYLPNATKGWEVHRACVDGENFIVVLATWIPMNS